MADAPTSRARLWTWAPALAVLLAGIVGIVALVRDEPGPSIGTAEHAAPATPPIEGEQRGTVHGARGSSGRAGDPAARDAEAPPRVVVPAHDEPPNATERESGTAALHSRVDGPASAEIARARTSSQIATSAAAPNSAPAQPPAPSTVAFGTDGRLPVASPVTGETGRAAAPPRSAPVLSPRGAGERQEERDEEVPAEVPLVTMVSSSSEVEVGASVSVTVRIAAARDIGHAPFHVSFDPQVLRFERGDEGPFLSSDGTPTAFFAAPTSDGAAVVVGLSRLGRIAGASGAGVLCTLHFVAVGPGSAELAFASAKLRDSANDIVPAQFGAASVSVR